MTSFVFQHLRSTRNIGDKAATPARWFDFGAATVQDFGARIPPCDVAVFGGGQVFNQTTEALIYRATKARHRVAWGIGLRSIKRQTTEYDIFRHHLALIGCRDEGIPGTVYVPCASCMAPRLTKLAAPIHEVVLYLHGVKSETVQRPAGLPTRTNLEGTFADAIDFLASSETVVTNSFHGTYWAMLMGRRVLCLPFSDKFKGFARMPALADPEDWLPAVKSAYALPGYLRECRAANRAFYDQVLDLAETGKP